MASHDPWIFRRGSLWAADLTAREVGSSPASLPASISPIRPDTFPRLVSAAGQMDPIAPDALAKRLAIGRQCFAAWIGDSVAAYGWVTRGPEWVSEFERELNVLAGEAYLWNCATVPHYRRHRLFSAVISQVAETLRQEGLKRLWIIGMLTATAMLHSVGSAGFEPVLGLTYVRLFNKRMLLTTPVRGASPGQIEAARRLLRGPREQAVGPLIVGNSSRPRPPDTHFDR